MAERTSPNIALTSLMAGLAGAGIALLLAPRSGKETREKLHSTADDLKHRAEDSVQHARDTVQTTKDSFSEALRKTTRKAKDDTQSEMDEPSAHQSKQSPILRAWEEEV